MNRFDTSRNEHIRKVVQVLAFVLFMFLVASAHTKFWLLIFIVFLFMTPLWGRIYCGYLCPMNTGMQISKKISKKWNLIRFDVPRFLKSRKLPWIMLILSIALMLGSRRVLHKELPVLIVLLILSMIVTLKYEPWVVHNHICPFGALLKLFSGNPLYKTQVDSNQCVGCKKCEKVCDGRAILVVNETKTAKINNSVCHQCQACTDICPVNAISYKKHVQIRD